MTVRPFVSWFVSLCVAAVSALVGLVVIAGMSARVLHVVILVLIIVVLFSVPLL